MKVIRTKVLHDFGMKDAKIPSALKLKVQLGMIKHSHPTIKVLTPSRFKCSEGHVWNTRIGSLLDSLVGCPECGRKEAGKKIKVNSKDFSSRVLKQSNGLLRASSTYESYSKKIAYVCANGHEFIAGSTVRSCPNCRPKSTYSLTAVSWLKSIEAHFKIKLKLKHALNGGEHRINIDGRVYKADGCNQETKTVFEFLGNFWHTNPNMYTEAKSKLQESPMKAYRTSMLRFLALNKAGYNVVFVWEADFSSGKAYSGILLGNGNNSSVV